VKLSPHGFLNDQLKPYSDFILLSSVENNQIGQSSSIDE
jgi:hypothetical protein